MSDLIKIGDVLALISGILAIIGGILGLIGISLDFLSFGYGSRSTEVQLVCIVVGAILVLIYQHQIQIADILVLGIVYIILGIIGGGVFAIVGGVLILIDYFLVGTRTTHRRIRRTYRVKSR